MECSYKSSHNVREWYKTVSKDFSTYLAATKRQPHVSGGPASTYFVRTRGSLCGIDSEQEV